MGIVESDIKEGKAHKILILLDNGDYTNITTKSTYEYDVFCNEIVEIL